MSDNCVDLSDLYVNSSVIYVDLSDYYVDLSEKYSQLVAQDFFCTKLPYTCQNIIWQVDIII